MMNLWNILNTPVDSLETTIPINSNDLSGEIQVIKNGQTYKISIVCFRGSNLIVYKKQSTSDYKTTINLLFGLTWLY